MDITSNTTLKSFTTTNPSNGNTLHTYYYMDDDAVEHTIQKSHAAFLNWKTKNIEERATLIKSIGKTLQQYKNELSELMTMEMGKLLKQSKQEIDLCTGICNFTADSAPDVFKKETRKLSSGGKGIITYAPLGVIYGIQPWNYPSYQVIRYAIANIIAGNTVLLKHANNVTGTALLLKTIFEAAGLPKNVFQVLIIEHKQSNTVIKHNLIQGVTLTGSPNAGKAIGEKAGASLKKTVLELGSNDAYIILEDADIELAVEKCVKGRIYNNGETCIAAKRFIVVDAVYNAFKTAFVAEIKKLKATNPMSDDADLGPMAREDLRDTLHKQVKKSVTKGATILCGGTLPKGDGYYYPATVLEHVKKGQPAYDDELFGPVAALIKAKDEADAIRIANDSRFGLGGAIFSENEAHAIKLAEHHFDTGMVFINSFGLAEPNMPFGGIKNSGYGREHGGFGMKEFVNTKSILISN